MKFDLAEVITRFRSLLVDSFKASYSCDSDVPLYWNERKLPDLFVSYLL